MKRVVSGLIGLLCLFAGCGKQVSVQKDTTGQWVLESYDADKGYVLRKDGVHYVATCGYYYFGPIRQDEYHPDEPELSSMPGRGLSVRSDDGDCTAILAYIHKAVPFQQYRSFPPDRLFFLKRASGSSYVEGITEFTIIEAK